MSPVDLQLLIAATHLTFTFMLVSVVRWRFEMATPRRGRWLFAEKAARRSSMFPTVAGGDLHALGARR